MRFYLLEWSFNGEPDAEIFPSAEELAGAVRLDLESAWEHESTFDVEYMGIYEKGTLTPLVLFLMREVPEMDSVDRYYEIRTTKLEAVAKFIVRTGNQ